MYTPIFPTIHPLGDHAITLFFGNKMDEKVNRHVHALAQHLQTKAIPGVKDIVPAYASLTVVFDLCIFEQKHINASAFFQQILLDENQAIQNMFESKSRKLTIPVCYDISFGIDLLEMTEIKKTSTSQIINWHCEKSYCVYMLGFLPGFPYMGQIDEHLALPRKTTPRSKVIAGSVGIAGLQTGIYPLDSPGGWQIIGRTPLRILDVSKNEPCFFRPNDEVQFVPISIEAFYQIQSAQ